MLSNPFKMIPSSMYMPLAVIAGGLIAWRVFSGSSDSGSGDAAASQSNVLGYDPSLVALGVQTSLERDKLNSQTELGMMALATEMHSLDVTSEMQGREIGLADTINARDSANSTAMIASNERMYGADMGYKHAALGEQSRLADAEMAQSYNLKNYQAMINHDLGKKGIKADYYGGIIGSLTSTATAML